MSAPKQTGMSDLARAGSTEDGFKPWLYSLIDQTYVTTGRIVVRSGPLFISPQGKNLVHHAT